MAKKEEIVEVEAEIVGWGRHPKLVEAMDRWIEQAAAGSAGGDGIDMLASILATDDVEKVAGGGQSAISIGTQLVPRPGDSTDNFVVQAVRPVLSDKQGAGLPIFVVIEAVNMTTGEVEVLTGGGAETTIRLLRLAELGGLPRVFQWERVLTPTKSGYHPINMRDLGRP